MENKYFGEIARFSEEEREEAKQYLLLWKKYLLRRLKRDTYNLKVIEEDWGERPPYLDGSLAQQSTMYLKLYIHADWNYELGRM